MTPLAAKLVSRIRANGPMTVAGYMTACLGDPEHGYYLRREPFGRDGDFVTAPEVSQMFGELIGAWAVLAWEGMGAPSPFVLAELGPGRGTLMSDLLRAARVRPAFGAAARVHLVETSARLRDRQRATLAGSGIPIAWCERIDDLTAGPLIVVGNEFFDALPVHQFVRVNGGWAERMVGVADDGSLTFGLRPAESPLPTGGEASAAEGAVFETSPASIAIVAALAARIARDGGAGLFIDYGHEGPAFGDTLQAVRRHAFDDPLAAPGEADLTAHVDFGALSGSARDAGALVRPVMSQAAFLLRMGLAERASQLGRGKDRKTRETITAAVNRLCGPDEMGMLFKVMAMAQPGLALAVFDDDDLGG